MEKGRVKRGGEGEGKGGGSVLLNTVVALGCNNRCQSDLKHSEAPRTTVTYTVKNYL